MSGAAGLPTPKTMLVRVALSLQRVQSPRSARTTARDEAAAAALLSPGSDFTPVGADCAEAAADSACRADSGTFGGNPPDCPPSIESALRRSARGRPPSA